MVRIGQGGRQPPRSSSTARTAARRHPVEEPGWLYTFEIDAAGRAIRAGKTEFDPPGMTLGRHARQHEGARQVADVGRPRIRDREADGGPHQDRRTAAGEAGAADAAAKAPGPCGGGLGGRARRRGLRDLSATPRSCSTPSTSAAAISSTPPGSMPAARCDRLLGDVDGGARRARGHGADRQGRSLAARLSRRDRPPAHRVARPAEDRLSRRLLHAPRQSGRAGRRVRRRDGCGGEGRPDPRLWRLELDARAHGRGLAYAEKNGRQPPGALSNNFSLAEMVEAPWAGCSPRRTMPGRRGSGRAESRTSPGRARRAASSPTARARQARQSGARTLWYSERNFARRDRAIELAASSARSRSTSRSPIALTRISR